MNKVAVSEEPVCAACGWGQSHLEAPPCESPLSAGQTSPPNVRGCMLLAQREPRTPAPKVLTTSEKLCVFCEHMEFDDGGTGEYADPATMTCAKGRWSGHKRTVWNGAVMLFSSDDLSSFREVILMAKDCPDYKPPK